MPSYNRVMLMGNLTRDPELNFSASGNAICRMGMAINRKFKSGDEQKEEVTYVDITVFGNQGENCAEYLKKGSGAFIEGRLNFSTWETDDRQKRSKLDVVGERVQFLSGAKE